jgi:cytidylate kinase
MISVYVHADHDFQMKSALERVSMSEKEMEKYIERTNKYRSDFYRYHTGRSWDDAENYDLCINSGKLGFEKTVELIESYINIK